LLPSFVENDDFLRWLIGILQCKNETVDQKLPEGLNEFRKLGVWLLGKI
jgi:hypothetical protein